MEKLDIPLTFLFWVVVVPIICVVYVIWKAVALFLQGVRHLYRLAFRIMWAAHRLRLHRG